MKAMDRVIKARTAMIIDQRFYGSLAMKLQLVEDPTCESAWVDGISLGFNPEFIEGLSNDELKGLIIHEVMHPANGHHLRRNGRNHEDWNVGCDYAIDPGILESGFALPGGGHISSEYLDQSAEGIYSILQGKKKKDPQGDDQQKNDDGQKGDDSQQGNNDDKGAGKGQDAQPNPSQGSDKGQDGQDPQAGSPSNDPNGSPSQGQASKGKPNPTGEVRDCPVAMTEDEKAQNQQEWQIAVAQAAQAAEGCGQMDGNLRELVASMLDPKVPWQEVLQRFVEQSSNPDDYSFSRPNVRYGSSVFIMPSLCSRQLPPIDIWVDTSGSISTDDKKQFVAEINDIRSHYRTTMRIIHCDTKIRHVDIIEPEDDFESLETFGGGGTKFSPAITWSMEQDDLPICGIYLTDLDCTDYGQEPDFPVLWIDTRGSSYTKVPPFGEKILMHHKRR